MAEHSRLSLLGLPGELRRRIYKLLVFHQPSGGIIAPLKDPRVAERYPTKHLSAPTSQPEAVKPSSSMTLISGRPMEIEGVSLMMPAPNDTDTPEVRRSIEEENDRQSAIYAESPNLRSNHYCTLEYLLQPQLARVNRQVHEESLQVLYSVNKFHFEMSNFVLATTWQGWRKDVRSPVDWWRAIGDTNLRLIQGMNVFVPSQDIYRDPGMMIKYRKTPLPSQITDPSRGTMPVPVFPDIQIARYFAADDPLSKSVARKLQRNGTAEGRLRAHMDVLKIYGLHVRTLECIIAELEPVDICYLRDESALDGPSGTGMLSSHEVEEAEEGLTD